MSQCFRVFRVFSSWLGLTLCCLRRLRTFFPSVLCFLLVGVVFLFPCFFGGWRVAYFRGIVALFVAKRKRSA